MRRATIAALTCLFAATLPTASARAAFAADATPPTGAVVNVQTNCSYFCFVPAQTTITAGGTVTWADKSGTKHNVSRCSPASCGVSGGTGTDPSFTAAHLSIPPNGTAQFTFTQPGTYVYYCAIHGYALMHGTITVTAAVPTTTLAPAAPAPVVTDPASVPATTRPGPPVLAHTGGNPSPPLLAGFALVVAGVVGTTLGRRRRRSPLA